jgi:hypothetical protein
VVWCGAAYLKKEQYVISDGAEVLRGRHTIQKSLECFLCYLNFKNKSHMRYKDDVKEGWTCIDTVKCDSHGMPYHNIIIDKHNKHVTSYGPYVIMKELKQTFKNGTRNSRSQSNRQKDMIKFKIRIVLN